MSGPRWNAIQWAASVATLIGTIAAVAKGFAPDRLRSVVAFAVFWTATASGAVIGRAALRRRAAHLKDGNLPRGVLLIQPFWIRQVDVVETLAVAGPLAAIAAVVGFPGVGVGIVIAMAALSLPMVIAEFLFRTGLVFEPAGMWIHKRHLRFFVEWATIVDVAIVPAANPPVNVEIADPARLLATLDPDTARNRQRIAIALRIGNRSGRTLMLANWAGGVDSTTLSRAIRAAMGERPRALN